MNVLSFGKVRARPRSGTPIHDPSSLESKRGSRAIAGQDPTTVEKHWAALKDDKIYWSHVASSRVALAAIDQALWDITRKAYGRPVHKLVGGAVRNKVRVYLNQWWAGYTKTDDLIEKAKAAVARGATALRSSDRRVDR